LFTLRCTRKLLDRISEPVGDGFPPTTRLGDWYANLLFARPQHLVLAVSERTLLPMLIPSRPLSTLGERFPIIVGEVLRRLEIPQAEIDAERREMAEVPIGKTANRRVLGVLNEFALALQYAAPGRSLIELALWLAETPCGPIAMNSPDRATRELFAGTHIPAPWRH